MQTVSRIREDVVLEKVDGIYVLVALRSAWKDCPFAVPTIPVYAEIWNLLKAGASEQEVVSHLQNARGFTMERSEIIYGKFLESARKYHYLKEEEDGR